MLKFVVFNALLLVCCGYAFLRGGAPERIGAGIYLFGTALTVAAAWESSNRFGSLEVGILVVDIAALAAFVVLALRANRFWPLWVAALQLLATAGHLAKLLEPNMIRWAYAFLLGAGSYPTLLLFALGTFRHQQRLKKFGVDRSWSSSWLRSGPKPEGGPTA
jgi:hypothetical protein